MPVHAPPCAPARWPAFVVLLLLARAGAAEVYHDLDPASMGLGGVGTALVDGRLAPLRNPAAPALRPADGPRTAGAGAGFRVVDPFDVSDDLDEGSGESLLDDINDGIDRTESALRAFEDTGSVADRRDAAGALRLAAEEVRDFNADLRGAAGEFIGFEYAAAAAGMLPRDAGGGVRLAVVAAAWGSLSATSTYADGFLARVGEDFDACARTLESGGTCDPGALEFLDDTDGNGEVDSIPTEPEEDLESEVLAQGLRVTEAGLNIARAFRIGGLRLAVGVTPRLQRVALFDYRVRLVNADRDDTFAARFTRTETALDLDAGALLRVGRATAGVTLRNLLDNDYRTRRGGRIEIPVQARTGVAWRGTGYRVGADLDLTENPPTGFGPPTRFLAVGGTLRSSPGVRLAAGLRTNLAASGRDAAALGVALTLYQALDLDVALTRGDGITGLAARLGATF